MTSRVVEIMNYTVPCVKKVKKDWSYTTLCLWLLLWRHSYFTGRKYGVWNKEAVKSHIFTEQIHQT
jgi:hypothetical protein